MKKRALITGITGQDGSYLAEHLLSLGYKVFGLVRRSSTSSLSRIEKLLVDRDITLLSGDMTDVSSLLKILEEVRPNEVYNLAAQSFVKVSFDEPLHTCNVTGMGTLNILEAIRIVDSEIKFYQAGSSEMFGKTGEYPQKETTPFYPRSPYGVAKVFSHWATINYRESYNIFACNGILFNHESPRRGEEFVTKKITDSAARIHQGEQKIFRLGNLEARRDWGYAGDYVRAMHMMLQAERPDNYVVATGVTRSVREFCKIAFDYVGLNYRDYVVVDKKFFRPTEVEVLCGNPRHIQDSLGWKPETSFSQMVEMMMEDSLA